MKFLALLPSLSLALYVGSARGAEPTPPAPAPPPEVTPPPAPPPEVPPAPAPAPPEQYLPPAGAPAAEEHKPQQLLHEPITFGGFGGPFIGWTRLNGQDGVLLGGRGGWLIDHRLVLGGAAGGIVSRIAVPTGATVDDPDYRLELGYGGFWIEYIVAPERLLHASIGVLIGGGSLHYTRFRGSGGPEDHEQEDAIFVVEPAVAAELNIVSFMRLDLYGSFRFVAGVDLPELRSSDVTAFGFGAMLKFGSF